MLELLAPAGSLSKLKTAILFGADAVYVGGEEFSLRTAADNFTREELCEGIRFAHERNKKVYVAVNIVPRSNELEKIREFCTFLYNNGADGVIVSDLGAFSVISKTVPDLPIHVSTQANITNFESACMWHKMGATRVVLARELSLEEITEIRKKLPEECEIETFVHGAMCVSYSGRCLLSNYMANRDSNRGACAQPCRWKYYLMEEKRPGQYMPVYENDKGSFIFNSKDLCMIRHIDKLYSAGVKSLKIEGRVKSDYYVATVIRAYRRAIDDFYAGKPFDEELLKEVCKVSHREYSEGFYFSQPEQIYTYGSYIRSCELIGTVKEYDEENKVAVVEQRNRFYKGDEVEFLPPTGDYIKFKIEDMEDADGNPIDVAPHPQMTVRIKVPVKLPPQTIVRKECECSEPV